MNEIERVLRTMQPREPSSPYLDRGLERIATSATSSKPVSPTWRYAAVGLALLFSASLTLNIEGWLEHEEDPGAEETTLVFSVLRQEGDLWVQETRYEYPATGEKTYD